MVTPLLLPRRPRRPTLVEIFNILENCDVGALEHNSAEYIYTVSMAMKAAFADRNQYLGDPDFVQVPWSGWFRRTGQRVVGAD